MNIIYLDEYRDLLGCMFSIAHEYCYSLGALERSISYSAFFKDLENSMTLNPIITDKALAKQLFPELEIDLFKVSSYNQCLWAAECYLRIQHETKFPFELIFLYIPIEEMYRYFNIYHEMDFSQMVDLFNSKYKEHSVFAILLSKYKFSVKEVSVKTGIPYETLISLKQRKRDISKVNVKTVIKIARFFHVSIETLSETSY